ncbi:hypothetical protein Pan216_50760 [Planctomycetes bacterium Pan216]|uniref:Mucoidy inhibitor MuiA family protein n=1 Tax=Kolteria novifilia TaxID=2527975 RepID=A0A518BB76_9BACT|nr:hypothetical protein Pan216_50760 [Planctomycetes bacterium Pan216]
MRGNGSWALVTACAVALLHGAPASAAEDRVEIKGKIDAVTVYQGQALVTRLVAIPGPAGLKEIAVTDLPEQVVPGSLYAESAEGIEVRSVLYRLRHVTKHDREEVRELEEKIREIQDELERNNRLAQQLENFKNYLSRLETFTAVTANTELTKGVLNAETLKALTDFIFEKRSLMTERELTYSKERRELEEELRTRQRELSELTRGSTRAAREAVIFCNVAGDGGQLRLRYLVNEATWSRSYNVRSDAERKAVTVEVNAQVQQLSGEEWTNVKMSLSTATPALVASAPTLLPLAITLQRSAADEAKASADREYLFRKKQDLAQRRRQIESTRNNTFSDSLGYGAGKGLGGGGIQQNAASTPAGKQGLSLSANSRQEEALKQLDRELNRVAQEAQVVDLLALDKSGAASNLTKSEEGISVSYDIAARTTLPSRTDYQLIQIASVDMKADVYRLAIPVLTSFVYEEAVVTNDSKLVLLDGPTTAYVAGQFVGRGSIPTVAVGEEFTVGFGVDSSLRTSRELLDKEEIVQGGNRVVTLKYRLAVENFNGKPVNVRLLDRLPTTKGKEAEVTLIKTSHELSEDQAYQVDREKKGLLRWDIEVPAQAIGPKAFDVTYEFKIEYDRQMTIAGGLNDRR